MSQDASGQREITLLQERNSGTFAQVFLARAEDVGGLRRIVAVKVLKARWTDSDDVLNRTRDEAQLLASLQHQNIVRVDAITEIDKRPAIIMEFVHGLDLAQLLKAVAERNTKIPPRAVYEIAEGIASALAAAWFRVPIGLSEPLRVVHRDIKPSNVMIGMDGELKVLDFGTARFEDAGRAAKTEAMRFGSLKYMSPERRNGDRGDHAADLYSLGLVILEMLGGRIGQPLPMGQEAHGEALIATIDAIPDFGLPNSGWDNSLRETLLRLCATDPDHRLDARQTVKLMRAFKEQAHGDGLIAYAEEMVAPLTHSLNAIPDLETMRRGEDAGKGQFTLHADGRTSVKPRMSHPPPSAELPTTPNESIAVDLPTAPQHGIADELPTQVSLSQPSSLLSEDEPTQSEIVETTQPPPFEPDQTNPRGLRPGFAMQDMATEELLDPQDDSSSWVANQKSRPAETGPTAPPGQPRRLPPPQAAHPNKRNHMLLIGCLTSILFLLVVGGGGAFLLRGMDVLTTDADVSKSPHKEAQDVLAEDVKLELHAGDPTVQWVRLSNANGDKLLTARPDGSGSFPPDNYTISVKVVARSVLSGTIDLNEDTSLTCKPATMGQVRCSDANGNPLLLLRP